MDIKKFTILRSHLYHLTDRRNLQYIIDAGGVLYSTTELVKKSNLLSRQQKKFVRQRRATHKEIQVDGSTVHIRDQRPISLDNLQKCIPVDWTVGDFIYSLNERVFFWPTINRLSRHFERYSQENPIIIKVETLEMLRINEYSEFCRLNSGATRSSSYHAGGPPPRGRDTFVDANSYPYTCGTVAEVTFRKKCKLPNTIWIGDNPDGPWEHFTFDPI
jgi:hypothetical protein